MRASSDHHPHRLAFSRLEQINHRPPNASGIDHERAILQQWGLEPQRRDIGHNLRVRRAKPPTPQINHIVAIPLIALLYERQRGIVLRLAEIQPDGIACHLCPSK